MCRLSLLVSIIRFFATASLLLLLASDLLERSDRRGFLLALRARLLHDRIEEGARRDPLTHLFNRKHLVEAANRIWNDAERLSVRMSAIMIDMTISRPSSEEMLVLMPGADRYAAERTADMIRDEIRRLAVLHPVLGPQAFVTASLGIADGLALPT